MEFSNSAASTISRPRVSMVIITAAATASIGYFLYQAFREQPDVEFLPPVPGPGLHRRNAVRARRRSAAADESAAAERSASESSEYTSADENANANTNENVNTNENEDASAAAAATDDWGSWTQPPPRVAPAGDADQASDTGPDPVGDYTQYPPSQRAGQNIVGLLFRVSEDNARRNAYVHRGCACNACGIVPIRGIRYRCANCADFDLCETCESQGLHIKTHIFYKVKVPAPPFGPRQMQPVWYPGDPDSCVRSLPRALMARLSRETGFERPELEAFWEQWTFMANTEWREDPDELCLAMDRPTFERCLVPSSACRHTAPNLIHERMFAFYDTNNDDLVGFAEFLRGLSYRKRKDKLRRVFDGYDMDRDGFVSRRDFLRIFRAYYVLYKQMHRDILEGLDDQVMSSTEAHQLVASRQPLSSLFGREGRVPPGEASRFLEGKVYHSNGDMTISDGRQGVVNPDGPDTQDRGELLYDMFRRDRGSLMFSGDLFSPSSENRQSLNGENDPRYLDALLSPPTQVDELRGLLVGERTAEELVEHWMPSGGEATSEAQQPNGDSSQSADELGASDLENQENIHAGAATVEEPVHNAAEEPASTTTPAPQADGATNPALAPALRLNDRITYRAIRERSRTHVMERRIRVEARRKLHERWRRRQFYLDEEEGAMPPDGWNDDEDVLALTNGIAAAAGGASSSSKAPPPGQQLLLQPVLSPRSRSSSKVRFAEDTDDYEVRSNPSTSSRSVPERWGGLEIPDAERDTGKEILYQVTQQAFNELLDILFKAKEDAAVEAAKTKSLREQYRALIQATSLDEDGSGVDAAATEEPKSIQDKPLAELLADSGYTINEDVEDANAPNGTDEPVEMQMVVSMLDEFTGAAGDAEGSIHDDDDDEDNGVHNSTNHSTATPQPAAEFSRDTTPEDHDHTWPQFRPNSLAEEAPRGAAASAETSPGPEYDPDQTPTKPATAAARRRQQPKTKKASADPPALWQLRAWKRLDQAEEEARARGGWGRLNHNEFEAICHTEEDHRNRLDYLGSWIDFCIP